MLKAIHLESNTKLLARDAIKNVDYHCDGCRELVTLKKGRIRIAHFAHRQHSFCSWGKGESAAHMTAKMDICDSFNARGLRAEVEVEVPGLSGDRRADIMVWSPKNHPVAIEVQHTPISDRVLAARTRSYLSAGMPVIWIIVVKPAFWEEFLPLSTDCTMFTYGYKPRLFEKWVHGYNFGRIYYYNYRHKQLWTGKFESYKVHRPYAEWWEETGDGDNGWELKEAGGYSVFAKSRRHLTIVGPYDLNFLKIQCAFRKESRIGGYDFPGGLLASFV